jgi:4'-phosphopantetheinyl transferase
VDTVAWCDLLASGPAAPPAEGEVGVWVARLDGCQLDAAAIDALLDAAERDRAGRFVRDADRRRYRVAHALLRGVLGRCLGRPPATVELATRAHGKPALHDGGASDLRFNLTHSHEIAACAVAAGREVGIDVEWTGRAIDVDRIAARFFAPEEQAALAALAPDMRPRAFHACWTRKEAYLTARGIGLSLPLDGFAVSVAPGAGPCALATRHEPAAAVRWSLRAVDLAPDYEAAVAAAAGGAPWTVAPRRVA